MKNTIGQKAFTLVELLVVIIILAICWAMGWDILSSSQKEAKPLVCSQWEVKHYNYSNRCQQVDAYNEMKYKADVIFCTKQAREMIDGTMSDTWGNDDYDTTAPSELMDKVYFNCLNNLWL